MSQLSVFLRTHGLAAVADAFKGVETTVVSAVQASPPVQQLETQTVDEVGQAAQAVVVGAIAKAAPGAAAVAAEVTTPLFAAIESLVIHFIQGATTTAVTKPPVS